MGIDIGSRIKDLRVVSGLTQEELADRTELSKGFISQLERDLTSPSISTLEDILRVLGVTIAEFFAEGRDEQLVFGEDDYFEKEDAELKNKIEWIIPNAQKNMMEPVLVELEAGAETPEDVPHEGEEFGYVLEGRLRIELGKHIYICKKGETFYYTADKSHRITNCGKSNAKFLWISTPPNF